MPIAISYVWDDHKDIYDEIEILKILDYDIANEDYQLDKKDATDVDMTKFNSCKRLAEAYLNTDRVLYIPWRKNKLM